MDRSFEEEFLKKMHKIDLYNEVKPRKRNKRSGAFRAVIKGTAKTALGGTGLVFRPV